MYSKWEKWPNYSQWPIRFYQNIQRFHLNNKFLIRLNIWNRIALWAWFVWTEMSAWRDWNDFLCFARVGEKKSYKINFEILNKIRFILTYTLLVLKNYNKNTIICYVSKNEFIRVLPDRNCLLYIFNYIAFQK